MIQPDTNNSLIRSGNCLPCMLKMDPPRIPDRQILTKADLERFQTSTAYQDYFGLISRLNESVKNQTLDSTEYNISANVYKLVELLDTMEKWILEFPPQDVGLSRFGNPSFRLWYDKIGSNLESLLKDLVPAEYIAEVGTYLNCSFGDRTRIDYGTGHEANFMCFLLCLYKLEVLATSDDTAVVIKVFWRYIALMRKLQGEYWLEPAGSHGVWGLDDYQFLPFLFGSSQLHGKFTINTKITSI